MRNKLTPLAILALAMFTTCSKSTPHNTSETIAGKWQLFRQYTDPGNGNGQWNNVLDMEGKYLRFYADRTLQVGPELDLFQEANKYEILNSSRLRLTQASSGQSVEVGFELKGKVLRINPYLCIEGCAKEFVRMDE